MVTALSRCRAVVQVHVLLLVLRIGVLEGFVVQSSNRNKECRHVILSESERLDTTGSTGKSEDDAVSNRRKNRLKTDFDRLFLGAPSMQEILSGKDKRESIRHEAKSESGNQNDGWFAEEQKAIEDTYDRMLHQMLAELQHQIGQDPEHVPSNAEAMLRDVLMQEKNLEIKQMKAARGREFFDDQQTLIANNEPNADAANLADELLTRRQNVLMKKSGAAAEESTFVPEYKEYEIDSFDGSEDDENEGGPETMKEWQMYRSIAARLGAEKASEEEILAQYQAWKDYVDTENVHRKKSGLTIGTRMPFAWQEDELAHAKKEAEIQAAIQKYGMKSNEEVRQEVDQKSIEALENLIQKTSDPARVARLQNTLMLLKEGLETGSLDASLESSIDDIAPELVSSYDENSERNDIDDATYSDLKTDPTNFLNRLNFHDESPASRYQIPAERDQATPALSSTPLSAQDDDDNDEEEEDDDAPAPLSSPSPATAPTMKSDGKEKEGYSLGTIEEQKLRSLYQRAGARTDEEKAAVRAQYEAFSKYEQSLRDANGLSETAGADATAEDSSVNYSDMTNEDGEIDAQKILASIGPRPTRRKKSPGGSDPTSTSSPSEEKRPTESS